MGRKTFVIVHNIPSPYRLHLFGAMNRELHIREFDFFVHFMSTGHSIRPAVWRMPKIDFPHHVWKDFAMKVSGDHFHFNPGLIRHLRYTNSEFLMVGGPWASATGIMTSFINTSEHRIAWIEGNTFTPGRINGPVGGFKRRILGCYEFVAVPGLEGQRYVERLRKHKSRKQPVSILPNLVDEREFKPKWKVANSTRKGVRSRFGIKEKERFAVWPARLNFRKGILNFLSIVNANMLRGWKIVIIGEGLLESKIKSLIKKRCLDESVTIHRYVPYKLMPDIYASADLFILASLSDPNPMSVVEAMHNGLPLLLSNRVGNFPEALEEGENGWGFDPVDSFSVREAVGKAFSASTAQLVKMGKVSVIRADRFWNTERSVRNFLDSIGAV